MLISLNLLNLLFCMPQLSSGKQQPLFIALVAISLLIAGIVYSNYFQQTPEVAIPNTISPITPNSTVPQLSTDLFQENAFLNLQTYQPVVPPQPSARPNPFAAP